MTYDELIKVLEQFPPERQVYVRNGLDEVIYPITGWFKEAAVDGDGVWLVADSGGALIKQKP